VLGALLDDERREPVVVVDVGDVIARREHLERQVHLERDEEILRERALRVGDAVVSAEADAVEPQHVLGDRVADVERGRLRDERERAGRRGGLRPLLGARVPLVSGLLGGLLGGSRAHGPGDST
jgi:hypothetical protein